MLLRAENVDIYTIALWLGHATVKSTEIYLHADTKLKHEAIQRRTDRHPTRPLPAARHAPRVPRRTVTI